MNGKFENLLYQFIKASKRFEEILAEEKSDIVRDSAIQRFEFTSELSWKLLKAYLEEKGGKDLYFPKDVIRGAFQAGVIKNDPRWLDMVDTRNQTSHIYNEAMAEKVYRQLPQYLPLFKALVAVLA
jgi:nucleotidyltransferase substrate binding protein (TIGR01987 family)